MVSFKGKASKANLMAIRILDENRAPNNNENFKMVGDPSRKIIGKIPLAGVGKLMPRSSKSVVIDQVDSNHGKGKVQGLENFAVKVRSGRRPLADLSNLNNNMNNQCRNGLSNNPRIKKGKLVGIKTSQGKTTAGSSTYRPRISFTKSAVKGNTSSKPIRDMKSSVRTTARLSMNDEIAMRRKSCTEINGCLDHQSRHSIDSAKFIKNQGVKLSRPRFSFATQKAMDVNTLSRKPVGARVTNMQAYSKLGRAPMTKLKSNVGISIAAKSSKNKVSVNNESVSSQESELLKVGSDGNSCSSNNVAVIISRSKRIRQKSYTLSLVEKSEARATNMQAYSKLGRAPTTKLKSNVGISIAAKSSKNKVSVNNESVSSQESELLKVESDGNSCSSDNVTVIISRSKRIRRKSYTSSLVEKSEIIGELADSANFIKKDELKNIDDNTNPLEVVEYVDDIYQYYWSMEVQNPLPANYMAVQSDITPRMRGILVNWLIEVHLKFHLMQETLFLMVQLLDRVLSVVPTKKDELQMVGLTALLLASKYEDYWHPKINELISISANSLTRDQMLAMEKLVLKKLSFRLNLPTPYVFMLRFLKAAESDKKLEHLAFYLIELCLGEYEALKWRPSLLCASAIYLARCTLQMTPAWTGLLRKYSRYEESQLGACATMILKVHKAACLKPTQILYKKYSSPDHSRVAALSAMDMLPTCP